MRYYRTPALSSRPDCETLDADAHPLRRPPGAAADVISVAHAKKALDCGVDGLILVCAGAGGHAGTLSPFALTAEVREFFDGPIALSGALSSGRHLRAAEIMGADYGYMGTRFIATREANAPDEQKQMMLAATAADIV